MMNDSLDISHRYSSSLHADAKIFFSFLDGKSMSKLMTQSNSHARIDGVHCNVHCGEGTERKQLYGLKNWLAM